MSTILKHRLHYHERGRWFAVPEYLEMAGVYSREALRARLLGHEALAADYDVRSAAYAKAARECAEGVFTPAELVAVSENIAEGRVYGWGEHAEESAYMRGEVEAEETPSPPSPPAFTDEYVRNWT